MMNRIPLVYIQRVVVVVVLVRLDVSYEDALQDGVILCKLMNIISPGSINKINPSGAGHFKICENLNK